MLDRLGTSASAANGRLTRRDFLKTSAIGAGAVAVGAPGISSAATLAKNRDANCILLFLVGGPSQLETFDPKPDAPSHIRGPFGSIPTAIPGTRFSEHLPKTARLADYLAIVRSVHTDSAPIHENGQQLMQTGRLCRGEFEQPHFGSVLSHLKGQRVSGTPAFAVLPWEIGDTGVSVGHGQTAGFLGRKYEPLRASLEIRNGSLDFDRLPPGARRAFEMERERQALRTRYGLNPFGQSCLTARRLVEAGVRVVTVNMFDTVFNKVTWDCHADGGSLATTLADYRDKLCPTFDAAFSMLIDDLRERGMLETTLVLAMGEFGRTPKINPRGGRDHWTGCWSVLLAGSGIRGGCVVGASDAHAAEPKDRPVKPAEIVATIYSALGVDPQSPLRGPNGQCRRLVDADPIRELFS